MESLSAWGSVLTRLSVRCPLCGVGEFEYVETLYDVPGAGKVLLVSGSCNHCGYRFVDLDYVEYSGPIRITFRAEDGDDVTHTLIIRGKYARIKSPELGFELEPGSASMPMVLTLEGLLDLVEDYANKMLMLEPDKADAIREFINRVGKARVEGGFTIIVEDWAGKSAIIPRRERSVVLEKALLDGGEYGGGEKPNG